MTNHERAEKIANEIVLESRQDRFSKATVWETHLISFIASHLDDAMREAIKHHHFTEKCCDACFDSGRDKGFAAARDKAAAIANNFIIADGDHGTEIAERIRAMEVNK